MHATWGAHGGIRIAKLREQETAGSDPRLQDIEDVMRPVFEAEHVHLRVEELRNDNGVDPSPKVGDGYGARAG
jgi:hypothetical protein